MKNGVLSDVTIPHTMYAGDLSWFWFTKKLYIDFDVVYEQISHTKISQPTIKIRKVYLK